MNTDVRLLSDGGGDSYVTFVPSPGLVIAVLVAVLVLALIVAGLVWWGWRRLRRSRVLETGLLQARAVVAPAGAPREIAGMRRDLNASLAQTRRVLATPGATDLMAGLLPRLELAAHALDTQMRLLQSEPDQGFLTAALPALRARVAEVTSDTVLLRRTALRLLDGSDSSQRALLETDLRDSLTGLEVGLEEIAALQRRIDGENPK